MIYDVFLCGNYHPQFLVVWSLAAYHDDIRGWTMIACDAWRLTVKALFGINSIALSKYLTWVPVFRVTAGNDTASASFPQNCGVPQGSVLGPLLFIFCTTPPSHLISNHDYIHYLYANDTQLYISFVALYFEVAKLHLQSAITSISISNSIVANLLTLNSYKTEFIFHHWTTKSARWARPHIIATAN